MSGAVAGGRAPMTLSPRGRRVLAICGGGNAGHALSIVASQTFDGDIAWLVGSEEKAALLREHASQGALRSTGVIEGEAHKLRVISADPAQVIPDADLVVIAVPAFAHDAVLTQINPYLKDTVVLGCAPSRSGFEFEASRLITGLAPAGRRRIFGLQTLPWSTRVVEAGKVVNFGALKARVLMATMPRAYGPELALELSQLFGTDISPTPGFLNLTLGNPGQHIHPGLMHGHFQSWQGETFDHADVPLFYADATDDVSASVEALSADTVAVARALEACADGELDLSGVQSIHEWLRMSYPTQTADAASVSTCFRTGPLQARKAPMSETPEGLVPDFGYRYLSEDVPYGLLVTKAIAHLADVPTPAIDQVVDWAETMMGKEYVVDGAVTGRDARDLPLPQNYGIGTLDALVDWYGRERSGVRLETASR
jgi:predicted dinucleotide-binding enzyme